jgi:hypothetical protein
MPDNHALAIYSVEHCILVSDRPGPDAVVRSRSVKY